MKFLNPKYFKKQARLWLFCVGSMVQLRAQQMPVISHFMYNKLLYNPASAGTMPAQFNANALVRTQWTDVKGAPTSFILWTDYRFKAFRMALGLNVKQDRIGANQNTEYNLNYSYQIRISNAYQLSMGLRAGFANVSIGNLYQFDDNDSRVFEDSAPTPFITNDFI